MPTYKIVQKSDKQDDIILVREETQTIVKEQKFSLAELRSRVTQIDDQIADWGARKAEIEALIAEAELELNKLIADRVEI